MSSSIKVIYIAGPFRGKSHYEIHQNICRAEALALEVWRAGHAAICPHLNTAHFHGAADDSVWLEGDLEIMKRCDAVLMTPDWKRSAGAAAEKQEAEKAGIPVFESLAGLEDYYKSALKA